MVLALRGVLGVCVILMSQRVLPKSNGESIMKTMANFAIRSICGSMCRGHVSLTNQPNGKSMVVL